ncbi:MAG: response regulator [Ideonella sp.]|nr:response regulator [Ideonella sp.]MCC7458849.1 response regulator [Nitrospira sp.]
MSAANAEPGRAAAPLRGKVLYIEDDETNVVLVRALLARHPGIEVLHAATGRDGIAMVRYERPDFVLLDMNLPDISGLEVVRELNIDITARGLKVNILTGDALSMDILKAMSLGAYEYWLKPLDLKLFEDGLRRALTGRKPDPKRSFPRR